MRNGLLVLLALLHFACQSSNQLEPTHRRFDSERLATPEEVEAARAAYLEHQALEEKTKKRFEKSN